MTFLDTLMFLVVWAVVLTPFALLAQRILNQFPLF